MGKIVLNYIGIDDWSRPVFKDENGKMFKDTNLGDGQLALCTVGGFNGEPNAPVDYIERYQNVEFEIIGMEEEPTKKEKFNYQMLSRLQSDCDYYLGNGNRNKKRLRENDIQTHINEMKRIYIFFNDDKKPEWITWNDILDYENKMMKKKV